MIKRVLMLLLASLSQVTEAVKQEEVTGNQEETN